MKKGKNKPQRNAMREDILQMLHKLHLSSVAEKYSEQNIDPDIVNSTFDERIHSLLTYELEQRKERKQRRLLKQSGMTGGALSVEDLDFSEERCLNKGQLRELAQCHYLAQAMQPSIVLAGATGVGKTWLAQTLGRQATMLGFTVLYLRYSDMIAQMKAARLRVQSAEYRATLVKNDLLIIDDFAMANIDSETLDDLLSLIDARSSVRATIYASQLPLEAWYDVFGKDPRTEALLDRIRNFSYKLLIKGPSMRRKQLFELT